MRALRERAHEVHIYTNLKALHFSVMVGPLHAKRRKKRKQEKKELGTVGSIHTPGSCSQPLHHFVSTTSQSFKGCFLTSIVFWY
jgi:hypothetical protein